MWFASATQMLTGWSPAPTTRGRLVCICQQATAGGLPRDQRADPIGRTGARTLDLAIQDLVRDLGEGDPHRPRRHPLQGGAGRVDLGLGGAAGFGEGG